MWSHSHVQRLQSADYAAGHDVVSNEEALGVAKQLMRTCYMMYAKHATGNVITHTRARTHTHTHTHTHLQTLTHMHKNKLLQD